MPATHCLGAERPGAGQNDPLVHGTQPERPPSGW